MIPPCTFLLSGHPRMATAGWALLYFGILCALTTSVTSERLTPAGQDTLAAAGTTAQATAPFTRHRKDVAWSGYGDTWRQVTIADADERVWPGITAGASAGIILLTVPGIPVLGLLGWVFIPGGHGAELGILTGIVLVLAALAKAVSRWSHLPRLAEFDGLILRQWQVTDDDSVTHYVAIDDGTRAWAFAIPDGLAAALTPGTLVHARVNPRLNRQLAVAPLRRLPPTPFQDA